ncbi:hypothetical protein BaRGS_00006265 [Batillaria attramentaria]|uniref:Uncharacterized protein n=1 Tax=Batillaria attramentaria TaxID=370345 RepID=A0ABD0LSH8_9CAEN
MGETCVANTWTAVRRHGIKDSETFLQASAALRCSPGGRVIRAGSGPGGEEEGARTTPGDCPLNYCQIVLPTSVPS